MQQEHRVPDGKQAFLLGRRNLGLIHLSHEQQQETFLNAHQDLNEAKCGLLNIDVTMPKVGLIFPGKCVHGEYHLLSGLSIYPQSHVLGTKSSFLPIHTCSFLVTDSSVFSQNCREGWRKRCGEGVRLQHCL